MSSGTKKIRLRLVAITQVEHFEVIEVPDDITEQQIEQLKDARFRDVDRYRYIADPHYWERGECRHSDAAPDEEVDVKVTIDPKYGLEVHGKP